MSGVWGEASCGLSWARAGVGLAKLETARAAVRGSERLSLKFRTIDVRRIESFTGERYHVVSIAVWQNARSRVVEGTKGEDAGAIVWVCERGCQRCKLLAVFAAFFRRMS